MDKINNRDHRACTQHPNFKQAIEQRIARQGQEKLQRIAVYNLNPVKCFNSDCLNSLEYGKKHNKFCSNSCAAHTNNLKRPPEFKPGPKPGTKVKVDPKTKVQKLFTNICKSCGVSFVFNNKRKTCSAVCKSTVLSNSAKFNELGGNKNNRAYGWYTSKFAGKVWLESSYEHKVAVELDKNNIKWERPLHLTYSIDNKTRRYYADFYLNEFDVYLDPKNDFLIKKDKLKIDTVCLQNNVTVIVLNKHQLDWNSIQLVLPE